MFSEPAWSFEELLLVQVSRKIPVPRTNGRHSQQVLVLLYCERTKQDEVSCISPQPQTEETSALSLRQLLNGSASEQNRVVEVVSSRTLQSVGFVKLNFIVAA